MHAVVMERSGKLKLHDLIRDGQRWSCVSQRPVPRHILSDGCFDWRNEMDSLISPYMGICLPNSFVFLMVSAGS